MYIYIYISPMFQGYVFGKISTKDCLIHMQPFWDPEDLPLICIHIHTYMYIYIYIYCDLLKLRMLVWKRRAANLHRANRKKKQNAVRGKLFCPVFSAKPLSNGDLRMRGRRHFFSYNFPPIMVLIGNYQIATISRYKFGMPTSTS